MLNASVVTENHPRTTISLTLQVVNDDGSLLAALICCASLCLIDAAIPLRGMLSASSCIIRAGSDVLLDPTGIEERESVSSCTVAVLSPGSDNAADERVPLFKFVGAADALSLSHGRNRCVDACSVIQRIMTAAVAAKLSNRLQ